MKAISTYGTKRVNAYEIIEDSLNLKDVRIFDYQYDEEGRRIAVLNKKETAIAQSKQELIKETFAEWIWKAPDRREAICKTYNTEDGRRRYVNYRTKHKPLPCDRPSINTPEDIALSIYASGKGWRANFEYFMNREYAYNRDKGKCKCCGRYFSELIPKHCHHVNPRLPIERINKVPNLAWLCIPCHRMVHNSPIPPELDAKAVRKIKKYREKLKK